MPGDNGPLSVYDYMVSYGNALKALNAEKSYFDSIADNDLIPQSERAYAVAGSTGIASDIGLLKSAHESFMLKFQGGVNPPSQEVLQRSRDLTAALSASLHATAQVVVVLNLVSRFVNDWYSLSTAQPTATTHSAAWLASHAAT
ncbi:MAG: hypothetical protein ACM31P_03395 [Actinomycetota bacterium]